MRVYVETNFLLELALEQKGHDACRRIVEDAETGLVDLAVPAFAMVEAYETVQRKLQAWKEKVDSANETLDQMGRTEALTAQAGSLRKSLTLVAVAVELRGREYRERFLRAARVIPIDGPILKDAQLLADSCGLKLPDATVLACVLTDATAGAPSCFLNQDKKGFNRAEVRDRLREKGCALIHGFEAGALFLRARRSPK